ncbi:MAG TPA: ABC transporter ATP-binding protein [Symbiobacteriaceae bacterium]|nr:ABC transporter ATP-binding protein [Symbiobacteriaceae bacterium]
MGDAAIRLQGLTKRYGDKVALSSVDLDVPTGSFFAILGPNGAGKTTLIRCLTGMLRPDGGTGTVLDVPLGAGYPPLALKSRIGYVPQAQAMYERMTPTELLAMCRGLHPRWDQKVVQRYMDLFRLPANQIVRHMSTGMKAQLALTLVMGGLPELLILDEPTLGLDPMNRHQYLQVLLADSIETGCTVILSSHDLHQIERLADRAAILVSGQVAVSGAIDDLKLTEKRVRVAGTAPEAALLAVPGVRRAVKEAGGWLLFAADDDDRLEGIIRALPGVTAVQVFNQSLEEIFLSYVS